MWFDTATAASHASEYHETEGNSDQKSVANLGQLSCVLVDTTIGMWCACVLLLTCPTCVYVYYVVGRLCAGFMCCPCDRGESVMTAAAFTTVWFMNRRCIHFPQVRWVRRVGKRNANVYMSSVPRPCLPSFVAAATGVIVTVVMVERLDGWDISMRWIERLEGRDRVKTG